MNWSFEFRVEERTGELRLTNEQLHMEMTERKKAETLLQESEKSYQALFEKMLDGSALHEIICDKDGSPTDYRFLRVNPAFEKIRGFN